MSKPAKLLKRLIATGNLGGSGFALDRLEERVLMSTVTWTGLGGDNKWTTGANWDTSSAPSAGDDLVFASGAARSTAVNDFASGTHFNSISFSGSGYTVSGNDIFLQAGMTQSVAGTNTYSGKLFLLNDGQAFSVATGGNLVLSNQISSFGLNDVLKTGNGQLTLSGSDDLDAEVDVSAGTLEVDGSIPTNVVLTGGSVTGSGIIGGVSATGGTVATGAATLLSSGDVSIGAGSTFTTSITGANTHGELDVTGAVSLGGVLSLSSTYSASVGDSFTLISNEGNNPIIGTFSGLAQGTTLTANGQRFQISYTGGDGNDVTLTRVQDTSSVTLGSSGATVFGQGVTFTATVTGAAPGAAAPTGTVQFFDGATALGGPVTLDGSGVATLTTSALSRASHSITAVYAGTTAYATSTSNTVSQVVSKSSTSVNVVQSVSTSVTGQDVTFTATVAAAGNGSGTPTGQVRFLDGVTTLGTVTLDGDGTASLHLSSLAVGSRTITVIYGGSGNYNSSSNNVGVVHTVNQDTTTVTVTSNHGTTTYNDSVTFSATVAADAPGAGTPTGSVTFFDGSTNLGSQNLVSGVATLTISTLDAGSHSITAVYGTDANFTTGSTPAFSQTVNAAATSTSVETSNDDSTYGDSLTFTATVTSDVGTVNTGTVSFYDGGNLMGTGNVSNAGVATFTTSALIAGGHGITAVYGATTNFGTSTADAIGQAVEKADTSSVVTSSGLSSGYSDSVTFTATITSTGGTPTGDVNFYDGETLLGTHAVDNNGVATLTLSTLDAGTHDVTAVYAGDENFNGQTSEAIEQDVAIASTGTAISTDGSPTTYGDDVTFTATVTSTAGTPMGDVAFYDDTHLLGTVTLDGSGVATLTLGSLGAGSHQVYADFLGSTDFDASSNTLVQGVVKANTSTAGQIDVGTAVTGQTITLTATVTSTGGTPTGQVEFYEGGTVYGDATLDENGVATLTLSTLEPATYSISAAYLGDGNFHTSAVGSGEALTVSAAATDGNLDVSNSTRIYGQSVTLTASFDSNYVNPTGNVSFYDGSTLLGTGTLDSDGQATLDINTLGAGTHAHLHAVLDDSADFTGSTTPDASLTVQTAAVTVSLTDSGNSNYTNLDIFTATVGGTVTTPTGNVAFFDGADFLATVAVDNNGQAVFQTTDLTGGDHSITALYEGDSNYNQLTSDAAVVNVAPITATVGDSLSSATITHGDTLTVTASVTYTGRAPTGTVELLDGDTVLDTQTLDNNGGATLTTSALGAGNHTLTIAYSGDDNFIASGHDDSVTVNQASTTTTVGVSGSSTSYLSNAEFTATVTSTGGTPTGTVTFFAWGNAIGGPVSLDNNGVATLDYADLPAGTYSITAVYTGDDNFSSSSDLVGGSHTVTQPATSVAAPTVPAHGTFGSSIDLTATVTSIAGTPAGTIEFFDGVTDLGSATVDGDGTATLTTSSLALGDHSITAEYNGNANYAASSTSASSTVHIQSATTTTLSSNHQIAVHGQSVSITVTVAATASGAAVPTGNVAIFDGDTFLQTSALDGSGQMTFTSSSLSTGSHDLTAEYVGDNDSVSSSTASSFTQTVNKAATTTVATVSSPVTVHGQSVNLIATISTTSPGAGVAAGTVQFFVDGNAIGSAQTVNGSGVATLATTALTTASHTITAVYSGNADFTTSSDNTGTGEFVTKDNASISVVASGSTVWGQQVTFTATMAATAPGAGTPTGTVVFVDGSTPISQAVALVNGSVSINLSNLTVADHAITVVYSGDDDFTGGSPHAAITQSVTQSPVTATLSSSSATSVYGEHFTLTAGVSAASPGAGSPTGTVTFKSDGNAIGGPVALLNGAATLDVSSLAVAGHTLTVVYNGDGNFLTGTSGNVSHTVNRAAADTTVTLSSNSSTFHQNVTLTATLTTEAPGAGTGTGTVTFMDGSTNLGTANLTAGVATLDIATLAVGGHTITAVYSGDGSFAGSIANGATETVSKATTSTGVVTSGSSTYSGPVTFTATVTSTAGTPTGTITFMDGDTVLGTQSVDGSGVATLTTSALTAGSHSITAAYNGDGSYLASGPTSVTQSVAKASSAVSVSSPGSITYGDSVVLSATVTSTAGTPTGTVTFWEGETVLGTGTVNGSGIATATVSGLLAGTHTVTAVFSGDSNFNGVSTVSSYTQSVSKAFASSEISVQDSSTYGDSVTITSTVTGVSTPTGTVTFYDGASIIGTGTLNNGVATLTINTLTAGEHDLTASYVGDSNFTAALSDQPALNVAQAVPSVSVTSAGAITYLDSVTVTATVTGTVTTPTGSVTFMDGDTLLDTVAVGVDGTASLEVDGLVAGDHNITAIYSGDDNYTENQSDGYTQTVDKAQPDAIVATQHGATYGDMIALRVTISSGTVPTGTVSFWDGDNFLGTQTLLDNGHTSLDVSSLTAGEHTLSITYSGDDNFLTATDETTITILPSDVSVSLSSPGAITYGDTAELSAVVSGPQSTPTGTVSFWEGDNLLGTADVVNGEADLGVTGLHGGDHGITAVYNGDDNFNTGSSDIYTETVNAAATSASVTSSNDESTYGDNITFTATLSSDGGSPTGEVTFHDGDSILGTGTLVDGVATLTTSGLAVGTHGISVTYEGNADFVETGTDPINQAVDQATPAISLTSSGESTYGDSVTFTATVSFTQGSPTGTVNFYNGDAYIGTGTVTDGVASATTSTLPAGEWTIHATYEGDDTFTSAGAEAIGQSVDQIATTTSVTSSGNTTYGQTVTFTATVSSTAGVPTGTVTFFDGETELGTADVNDAGVAILSRINLLTGSHDITAEYNGDSNSLTSTSSDVTQTVSKTGATISLSSTSSSPAQNASVTFTATVSTTNVSGVHGSTPSLLSPSGTVTFKDGTTILATVDLVNGVATYTTTALALGGHSITAVYNGAANFNTNTSTASTVTVRDVTAPTAAATVTNVQSVNATKYIFTVSFADDTAVDVSTIINKNVVYVTGPKGFAQYAKFLAISGGTNGSPRVATYQITPPGGSWDAADAGTYTVHIVAGQIKDSIGNTMAATTAGSFYMSPTPFFDERYYLAHNADVASAVASGALNSGYQHFIMAGQFEGRDPSAFYSEKRYLAYNPDVAKQVRQGLYKSGFDQLLKVGLKQKRQVNPFFNETFYLAANPDVAAQVKAGLYVSGLQQYLLVGQFQGRNPSVNFIDSYYRTQNPSVVPLVQSGAYESAFEHFLEAGQQAGLSANTFFNEQFYLTNYPGVAAAVAAHQFHSGLEHYILFGAAAGYLPNASAKPKHH